TPSRVTTKVMLLIIPWFSGVGEPSFDQIIHTCSDSLVGAMSGTAGPRMKSSTSLAKALRGAHWLPMPASAAAPNPSLSSRRREIPAAVDGVGGFGLRMAVSGVVVGMRRILTKTDRPGVPWGRPVTVALLAARAAGDLQFSLAPATGRRVRAVSSCAHRRS